MLHRQNIPKAVFLVLAGLPIVLFCVGLLYLSFSMPTSPDENTVQITDIIPKNYITPYAEQNTLQREHRFQDNLKFAYQQFLREIKEARRILKLNREEETRYLEAEEFKKKQQDLQLKRELNI